LDPTGPSTRDPFPELLENAGQVPNWTLNHIDHCIFIAEVDFPTILRSLGERGVLMSLATLLRVVATHRRLLAAVLVGSSNSIDESALAMPYRLRLGAYRRLAKNPQVLQGVLQERWQALEAAYQGAVEEAAAVDQQYGTLEM
jgi:hypothetical protein